MLCVGTYMGIWIWAWGNLSLPDPVYFIYGEVGMHSHGNRGNEFILLFIE